MSTAQQTVDHSALKVNQAGIIVTVLVAVLAFVNLAFGYCVGCQIYFQLGKRGLIRA